MKSYVSLILLGQDQLALIVGPPPQFHNPYAPVITAKWKATNLQTGISVPHLLPQCSSRQPQIVLDVELRRLIAGGSFDVRYCANPPLIIRRSHGL